MHERVSSTAAETEHDTFQNKQAAEVEILRPDAIATTPSEDRCSTDDSAERAQALSTCGAVQDHQHEPDSGVAESCELHTKTFFPTPLAYPSPVLSPNPIVIQYRSMTNHNLRTKGANIKTSYVHTWCQRSKTLKTATTLQGPQPTEYKV